MLPVLRVNTLSDCLLSTTPVRAFSLQAHINTTSNMPGSTSSTRRCSSSPSPASRPHLEGSCACTPSGISTDTKGTANHTHSPPFSPLPSDLGVPVSGGVDVRVQMGEPAHHIFFEGLLIIMIIHYCLHRRYHYYQAPSQGSSIRITASGFVIAD